MYPQRVRHYKRKASQAVEDYVTDPEQTLFAESEKYVSIPEWVLLHPLLSAPAVRLYGVLKMYARKSERAWPGRATLGDHLECSEDSIDRYMKQLRDAGAVRIIPRWIEPGRGPGEKDRIVLEAGPGRRQTSNIYRLRWTDPDAHTGPGGSRKAAAPTGRKPAALPAADPRPEVHALEAHTVEAPGKARARESSAHPVGLALQLLELHRGKISIGQRELAQLLTTPLTNGVPPDRLKLAIGRIIADGQKLAPWTLQEYVAKVARDFAPQSGFVL